MTRGAAKNASTPAILWTEVVRAREALALQRQQPQGPSVPEARIELLYALEAYVESLEHLGRPIPYAIRDELRIQQLTCPRDRRRRQPSDGEPRP